MATLALTVSDPQGRLAGLPLLVPTLQAALDYIDRYVVMRGTVDVEIVVETTSTGRFAGSGDVAFAGSRGGLNTWEAALLAESRSGTDPRPGHADLSIYIDPASNYLAQMWWDPAIASRLDANPPDDRTDAFTVMVHEILHGMGIIGWRSAETGELPAGADDQSVWDSQLQVSGGRAVFAGPATTSLLGQPVEVRLGGSQGGFHLGNGPDLGASAMPWIERANFNSYHYYLGERYTIGRLELALLQDLGWTLEGGITLTDVVNTWEDRSNTHYKVGWDSDESLSGDVLADHIEGRGGRDLLAGLDGDDRLDGGEGDDTLLGGDGRDSLSGGAGNDRIEGGAGLDQAHFALVRSAYAVSAGAAGVVVQALSGGEGCDEMVQVERLRFADLGLAFDLGPDAAAGLTARLIGAVFGPQQVGNPAYVGIGLQLFDGGASALDVAQLAITARVGGTGSHTDVVRALYVNVVGVAPDAEALRTYTALLDAGTDSPASLALMAARLELTAERIDLVGLAAAGLEFTSP